MRAKMGSILILPVLLSVVHAHLRLYMSEDETLKLVGLKAELVYVYKYSIMNNALAAPLTINASYTDHILNWQNLDNNKQMNYAVDFTIDYPDGLVLPIAINISSVGVVPTHPSALKMVFNCTGKRIALEIDVRFNISNWLGDNVTSIRLKRKKVCTVTPNNNYKVDRDSQDLYQVFDVSPATQGPGYLATKVPKPSSTEIFYVAVGVASAVIILVAVVIFTLYIRTRRHSLISHDRPSVIGSSNHSTSNLRLDGHKHYSVQSLPSSRRGTLSSYSQLPPTVDIQITLKSLAINRKSVTIGETLMEGEFGRLLHGKVYVQDESEDCYEQQVLVKTLSDEASDDYVHTLLMEGSMLKGLTHQYINPLIGVCLDGTPLLIYPTCEKGNLKTLLHKSNRVSEHFPVLNTQQLVCMAMQVVKGLHYLHRKHIIHKDIAARNCCVDAELNVKVTDNALSKDLFPQDYIALEDGHKQPVKWVAFETLADGKYSYETDIWSFGVLLWELITFAQQPYNDVNPYEMSSYLYSGCRLLQPVNCPDELFAVMAYCWAVHPTDRPSLTQILACLQEFHNTLSCFV